MKKYVSLLLSCVLVLGLAGGAMAQAVTAAQSRDPENELPEGAEMMVAYSPAPYNMKPDAHNEYPYMGVTFDIPDALLGMIERDEVFMLLDSQVDYGIPEGEAILADDYSFNYEDMRVDSAALTWLFIPEEARDGVPTMDRAMAGDYMDYDAFLVWKEGLETLGTLFMYHKDKLPEAVEGEALGVYGDYAYYFSVNEQADAEIMSLVQALKESVSLAAPRQIDERFTHLAGAYTEEPDSLGAFSTVDLDGNPVTEEIFKAAKVTMVNIWTTWCSPCIQEMPDLGEIAREMGDDDFQLISIVQDVSDGGDKGIDEERLALAKIIVERTGADYTTLVADAALMENVLSTVLGFPTTFFVDQEGNVLGESVLGSCSKEEWVSVIQEMLALAGES